MNVFSKRVRRSDSASFGAAPESAEKESSDFSHFGFREVAQFETLANHSGRGARPQRRHFANFSLFVQPNPTVIVAFGGSALAVAAAVFLIMELNSPFGGLLQISSGPAHATLGTLTR